MKKLLWCLALLLLPAHVSAQDPAPPPYSCPEGTQWTTFEGPVNSAGGGGLLLKAPAHLCFYKGDKCDVTGDDLRVKNRTGLVMGDPDPRITGIWWKSEALGVTGYRYVEQFGSDTKPLPDKYCALPTCFKVRTYEVTVAACKPG